MWLGNHSSGCLLYCYSHKSNTNPAQTEENICLEKYTWEIDACFSILSAVYLGYREVECADF